MWIQHSQTHRLPLAGRGTVENEQPEPSGRCLGEILIVEDAPASLRLLAELLGTAGYATRQAPNGELALWSSDARIPDLVLLDIRMPGMNGFDVCRKLKDNPATQHVPVIFLSAQLDIDDKMLAFAVGAVDFIAKPYVGEEVLARVHTHLLLARLQREQEQERAQLSARVTSGTVALEQATAALQQEIDGRHATEEQLRLAGTVFECSFDGIMVTDAAGQILTVNPAFSRMTGYAAADVIGQTPQILNSGKHEPTFFRALWQQIQDHGRWSGEIWNRRKDGNVFPSLLTISAVQDRGRTTHYISFLLDISANKDAQLLIDFLTAHDALTGLPNRQTAAKAFDQATAQPLAADDSMAVLSIDLDGFQKINALFGHPTGDQVLQRVAGILSDCMAPGDIAFRQGADEFIVLHRDASGLRDTGQLAQAVLAALQTELEWLDTPVSIQASVGIAVFPHDGVDFDHLVRSAGSAQAKAKRAGGNAYRFFTEEMDVEAHARHRIEVRLRNVLARNELALYYQPQLDLTTGRITGAEALLRWHDPEQGFIPPDRFIPIAEACGHIVPIGEWVINSACEQIALWNRAGLGALRVAVNLSARQFQQENLCHMVSEVLSRTGVAPACLELEITESAVIQDTPRAIATLQALKQLGVSVALDDFGTGYSSLSYLKQFPIDVLKIDKSFVHDIMSDRNSDAIVRSIIALAHNLQLAVVAEGVESAAQRDYLHHHGCDMLQGYLFSKPLPVAQFGEFVANYQASDSDFSSV